MSNRLYFGDNIRILSESIAPESVDLVYLDPPFNSQARYNVLFKSPKADAISAQAAAFLDFWSWQTGEAEAAYHRIMTKVGGQIATFVSALRSALGESDMMAYLVMMAVRLHEMHRVLKPTGSLYLHCDPTASHYLKILLDGLFGAQRFTNELVWIRSTPKGHAFTRYPSTHDVILYYKKGKSGKWNPQYVAHRPEYIRDYYNLSDANGRRFQATSLINPATDRPNLTYEFYGHTKVWRWTKERMREAEKKGRIYFPPGGGVPREKRFLDEQEGTPVTSVWSDVSPVNARAIARMGYPTQKPIALLERVILASSDPGDVILDPFCGCGTTVEAAQKLKRQWIGIDVSIHAVHVIQQRLRSAFGDDIVPKADGIPADYDAAASLASQNPFQFQWWANYLIGVHTLNEVKKGPDRGIDGELFFPNGPGRPYGRILTFVKGGKHVTPAMVREFRGVIEREKAEMGLFICLEPPTEAMKTEAVVAGFADVVHGQIQRLQIVSIAEWFRGRRPIMPPLDHLPYAAFSQPVRSGKMRRVDPNAPELPLSFLGDKANEKSVVRHLNPVTVTGAVA